MDWSEQVQKMMQSWAETQQKMWSSWLESVEQLGRSPGAGLWDRTLDTWQQSVNKTLDVQEDWVRAWAGRFRDVEGAPREVHDWAQEGEVMMKRWNDAQRELWDQWFEVLRKTRPEGGTLGQSGAGEDLVRAWQETARKAVDAQTQWAAAWAGGGKGGGSKKAGRSPRRGSS